MAKEELSNDFKQQTAINNFHLLMKKFRDIEDASSNPTNELLTQLKTTTMNISNFLYLLGETKIISYLKNITDQMKRKTNSTNTNFIIDLSIISMTIISADKVREYHLEEVIDVVLSSMKVVFRFFPSENYSKKKKQNKDRSLTSKIDLFLEKLENHLKKTYFSDHLLFSAIAAVAPILFAKFSTNIQLRSMNLITLIAKKYPSTLEFILSEISKAIPLGIFQKTKFRLKESEFSIQIISALIIQLIQNISNEIIEENDLKIDKQYYKNIFEKIVKISTNFLQNLIEECQSPGKSSKYLNFLEIFVKDLLITLFSIDWPSSETILQIFCSLIIKKMTLKKGENLPHHLKVSFIKIFGQIVSFFRKNAIESRSLGLLLFPLKSVCFYFNFNFLFLLF